MIDKLSGLNFKLFLFIVFVANLLFRLYNIDLAPFSYDESITLKDTLLDFGHIKHEAEWDANPPFYYYCIWIWVKIFGTSEFTLRAFSALMSALSLLIVSPFLAKNYSRTSSLAFVLIFTFHPVIFYYAQEARCYSLVLLLTSLTLVVFKNFMNKPSAKSIVLLALFNFLLLYTHYITFFILFFQLVIILASKNNFKFFSISAVLTLILILIRFTKKQFLVIFGVGTNSVKDAWIQHSTIGDYAQFIEKMYFHYLIYIAVVLISGYLLYKSFKSDHETKFIILFIGLTSLLAPILFFVIGTFTPIFIDRYVLYAIYLSFIAIAISCHFQKSSYLIVLALIIFSLVKFNWCYNKGFDMRSVAEFVKTNQKDNMVIINTKDLTGLFLYYYNKDIFKQIDENGKYDLSSKNIYSASSLADFKSLDLDKQRSILLFQGFDNEASNKDIYGHFREKGFSIQYFNIFTGIKFVLLKK